MSVHIPSNLLLQWHITERCNLRCTHCYQDEVGDEELNFDHLLKILEQFKTLLTTLNQRANKSLHAHITVTGGEPFVRSDFLDLLEILAAHRRIFSFAILTNGSFIDATIAQRLRQLAPGFVQVSIEGSAETHDRIRGQGHFAQTVTALKHLRRQRLRTMISFTAHRINFQEFSEVARLGRQLGVDRVWADRLIPCGKGTHMQTQIMTPSETKIFFDLMAQAQLKAQRAWFNRTEISMRRALQFLAVGGYPYHCTAGDSLLTVQPNGDLYPCRRLPIKIGNLLQTPLLELYDHSNQLQQLRQHRVSEGCQTCFYAQLCRGGLRCLSYAVTGNPFQTDPGCWLNEIHLKTIPCSPS